MDYSRFKISGRQIRLITILAPPADAPDRENALVQCVMSVRKQPLLTTTVEPLEAGFFLPSNYISFDGSVTKSPEEIHVAELRQGLAPHLQKEQTSRAKRVVDKLFKHVLRRPPGDLAIMIAAESITKRLNPEEKLKLLAGSDRRPRIERRIWGQAGEIHAFEDAAGYGVFLGEQAPQEHTGLLFVDDLNPFFRVPGSTQPQPVAQGSENYVAISYTWGPPEATAKMIINGETVTVQANLEFALRRFRTMDYFRQRGRIWIDSLCINQADKTERESQVQMMASIYRNAGNVIVWLGPQTESSDLAISFLESFGADYRAEYAEAMDTCDPITANTWRTMAQVRMQTAYDKARAAYLVHDENLHVLALPLFDFFDRPYWKRLWIIQELCMGRAGMPIVCGNRVTQWRYIRDGILKCTTILDLLDEVTGGKLMQREDEARVPRQHSLLHVAQIAQLEIMGHKREIADVPSSQLPLVAPTFFEHGPLLGSAIRRAIALASQSACSNPHDRIYGMLNIPGLPDLGIKIDYDKRLADVFTEFTASCVRHANLDFFSLLDGGAISPTSENGQPQDTNKPSWVPDYGAKPGRKIGIIEGEWNAGGFVSVRWGRPVVNTQGRLICRGKVVGEVDGVGAISRADLESGAMEDFADGDDLASVIQPKNAREEPVSAAGGDPMIHDVLVGGSDGNGARTPTNFKGLYTAFPVEEPPQNSPFYRNWHFLKSSASLPINGRPLASYFSHMASPSESDQSHNNRIATAAVRQAMTARTKMRRLIITGSGLLGLAPVRTRSGDAVIAIAGHGKPVIARKATIRGSQDCWHIIGEAYVRGMMNAEKLPLSTKPWYYQETEAAGDILELMSFV